MKARLAVLAALAAFAVAGCGGGGGGGGSSSASSSADTSAAGLAPAGAPVFVAVNTDFSSDQLQAADDLVSKFPIRERALRELRSSLLEEGVDIDALRKSAGPEVDVAVLDLKRGTVVGFAKPSDRAEFNRQLEAQQPPLAHTTSGDWTLFARTDAALTAVTSSEKKLADVQAYRDARGTLPGEAIVKVYANGEAVTRAVGSSGTAFGQPIPTEKTEWISAAVSVHDDGLDVQAHVKGEAGSSVKTVDPELADLIPAGSVAALSFNGLAPAIRQFAKTGAPFVAGVERILQVPLTDVASAVGGSSILYVRPSALIPEITLVVKTDDESKALSVLDRLAVALGQGTRPKHTTVDGLAVRELDLGSVSVYYGVVDGKVVVSDASSAFRAVQDGPDKTLADDGVFADAKDAAGMPDETNGWLFLNLKDGIPLVESFARLGNQRIPPEVEDNLQPLRSALVYGSRDGDLQDVVAFVQTS
jgi:hypothetical protein